MAFCLSLFFFPRGQGQELNKTWLPQRPSRPGRTLFGAGHLITMDDNWNIAVECTRARISSQCPKPYFTVKKNGEAMLVFCSFFQQRNAFIIILCSTVICKRTSSSYFAHKISSLSKKLNMLVQIFFPVLKMEESNFIVLDNNSQ